jgi:type IV fimbrial biogenesis protein FimT
MFNSKGFSLLEILVTLFILSILLSLAIPSYRIFLHQSQDKIMRETLFRAIHLARSEAMSRGEAVSLGKNGKSWEQGIILFVDQKEDGSVENAEQIIVRFDAAKRRGVLHWRSALGREYLRMLPSGIAEENAAFWFCAEGESQSVWGVMINQAGKARLANNAEMKLFPCA